MAAVRRAVGQEGLMMALSDLCPELLHSRGHVNKATEPGSPLVIEYRTRWGREEANASGAHRAKKGGEHGGGQGRDGVRNRMANGMRSGVGSVVGSMARSRVMAL